MFPPAGRPDISDMLYNLYSGGEPPSYYTYPDYVYEWTNWLDIERGINTYSDFNPYNNFSHWDGSTPDRTFSEESSVGQIFISDNLDVDLKGEPMRRDSFIKVPKKANNKNGAL